MSKFIQIADYDASIHRDNLDAVTRSDAGAVEQFGQLFNIRLRQVASTGQRMPGRGFFWSATRKCRG